MLTLLINRRAVLLLAISLSSIATVAQNPANRDQPSRYTNPEGLSKPTGYTHVVLDGGTVYISGQVSVNEKGEVVGKGDLRAQVTRVYENLALCLKAAGLGFGDIVKMNTYVVNYKPVDVTVIREVRKNYLSGENPPASTLVGVTALVNPDFMIEIEAIARIRQ
jgi:enamine deaminase RidA (YjgF/YER057c/UK114 family)